MITFVDALIGMRLLRVRSRTLVVEFSETCSIKVRRDAQHPGGGDGVQRLEKVLPVST